MEKFENWATRLNEKSTLGENDVLKHFQRMNKQGWELVAVLYGTIPDYHEFYWKRALPESNDKTETK